MAKRHKLTAFRLVWQGKEVAAEAKMLAERVMARLMFRAEKESKVSLYPGRGVDTKTMKDGIHVAEQGYNWAGDHTEPAASHPVRGGVEVMPTIQSGGRAHGASVLELGSGQTYAIFFHQKHYPFLRIPWEKAMEEFKAMTEAEWRKFLCEKLVPAP